MAINFTSFLNAPSAPSKWASLLESAFNSYQEAPKRAEEQKQRELATKLKSMEAEHKPKEYEQTEKERELVNSMKQKALDTYDERFNLDKQIKQAQLNKANSPEALKGALATAFKLRNDLDPNSPTYEEDKKRINNYINNLGQKSSSGAQTAAPGEGIKINLPEGKKGYVPGLGKLKTGWLAVTDAQGKTIGVNVPMSDAEIKQWKSKEKFDVIYPFLNDSLSNYSGKGSWENFTKDARNYGKDPEAKERIDNYFAAKKLISIGSTTENARIGGHATNTQLKELKTALDSSEVHKKLQSSSSYILPKKYSKASGTIFKSYLDKVENAAKKNIPAYEFRALNPESNNEVANEGLPKIIETKNGKSQIKYQGETYYIPVKLVDAFIKEKSKPAFGGQYE